MDEKMIEKILDNLIEEAGPLAIEEMSKEDLASLNEPSDIKFSKRHEQEMKKIFALARREQAKKKRKNTFRKVAVLALAAVLMAGLTISSVGAWRESFVKYFLDMKEEYSSVNDSPRGTELRVDDTFFGYVPVDYTYKDSIVSKRMTCITFVLDEKYIVLESRKQDWAGKVNTESGEVLEIVINNKDMVYFEREDLKVLTWHENGAVQILTTNDSKEKIVKMAEKIEFIKN